MDTGGINALRGAVMAAHGVNARWLRTERAREQFGDVLVWEGDVEVFALDGHAAASVAYAWAGAGLDRQRALVVLGVPPVDSAGAAVRAMMKGAGRAVTLPRLPPVPGRQPRDE